MAVRYLHVIHSLDPAHGGPSESARQLSAAALAAGHQPEILTLDAPGKPWQAAFAGPVHALGPSLGNFGYAPRLRPWLAANVERFDGVLVSGLWQYQGYAVWRTLRGGPTPYYVLPHGMLDPWFRREYPLKHMKKALYWNLVESRVLRDARAVLFTSEEERRLARGSFTRYTVNERLLHYGTPGPATEDAAAARERFLARWPALRGTRIVLFLGRIHPKKGLDLAIEAFAACAGQRPELRLVIAGPDQVGAQRALAERAAQLGVADAIVWTGMLGGEEKFDALRAAEVFLLPSHQENFGIAVAEALACGLPALISNKVNIWREIVEARAGLAADDTLAGTTQLLQDWLAQDAGRRAAMSDSAVACFRRHFHIEAAMRSLTGLIAEVRAARPGPVVA
jgi:glycosyltransferase involved in cell wall biosynthesis